MRSYSVTCVIMALLGATACSRQRSSDAAPRPAAATSLAQPNLAEKDLAKLQGTWRIVTSVWNGVREADVARSITILFQDDKFIVIDTDGHRQEETIRLMPDQNPKAIDCSSKADGLTSPGIYSLEGDLFTWCAAGGDRKVRPTEFASQPRSKHRLMILRRQER
ncbi:MAG TPA: TIGR03067 domain-containing protein [Gemmataceae bacterium]|nr:TIGR03067 domain-containing protein [Gemmataceae bacterium]